MADLSDVTAYLAAQAAAAVYPNGVLQPSIAPLAAGFSNPMDVRIFEGCPVSEQLDLDLAGKVLAGTPPTPRPRANGPCANVSIFPLPGGGSTTYQILDHTTVQRPVAYGLDIAAKIKSLIGSFFASPGAVVPGARRLGAPSELRGARRAALHQLAASGAQAAADLHDDLAQPRWTPVGRGDVGEDRRAARISHKRALLGRQARLVAAGHADRHHLSEFRWLDQRMRRRFSDRFRQQRTGHRIGPGPLSADFVAKGVGGFFEE